MCQLFCIHAQLKLNEKRSKRHLLPTSNTMDSIHAANQIQTDSGHSNHSSFKPQPQTPNSPMKYFV